MILRRTAAAAASSLAVCLMLAGCTAAPEVAETPAPTSSRTPAPLPTTEACIVGTWEAGASALQPMYDAIPVGLDYPTATLGPEASVIVVFAADGTFAMEQDVPATLTWQDHPAAVRLGGAMHGAYSTEGDALALTATENTLTATPSDDRTASALFAIATQETLDEWPVSATSFSCAADRLVLDLETEGHAASVEFTRRPR